MEPFSPLAESSFLPNLENDEAIAHPLSFQSDNLIGTSDNAPLTGPTTESNDSLTQATQTRLHPNNPSTISLSGTIGDNPDLSPGQDVDFYVVRMNAGDRLTIDIDADELESFLDSGLRLFDASGNELMWSDDDAAPGENLSSDSYIDFTATATGNYYIGVGGSDNRGYRPFTPGSGNGSSTGDYDLNLTLLTQPEEANDTLTTAILTGLTADTPGTVNYIGAIGDNSTVRPGYDVDVFTVQLNAGNTLTADLDALSGSYLDSVFRLFDAEGNEVARSDDDSAPDEDLSYDPFLNFTATEAGNYYLSVSGDGNVTYDPFVAESGTSGSTGGYSLNLAIASDQTNDVAGDTIPDAYNTDVSSITPDPFTLTTTIGDNPDFTPGLDVDFFSFQLDQGDLVTIDIDTGSEPDDLHDSVLILFDEAGNELAFSDDAAAPGEEPFTYESYITFIAPETGVYYVGVTGYSNTWYDPFVPGSGNEAFSTGEYTIEIAATNAPDGDFSTLYGYGMVDASEAVAAAVNAATFPDVDNLGGDLWGLDMVNAPEAWEQGHTGEGTVVAVLDTGVDYTHVDLTDNIWSNPEEIADNGIDDDGNGFVDDMMGWNFVDDTNDPMDWYGHGTHVSGTIAGLNNDLGITGVAYDSLIMPVSVIGDYGVQDDYEYLRDIASGIYYAVDNGADVINMSLGYAPEWFPEGLPPEADAVVEAIAYAEAQGTVVVMAAGNDYDVEPGYPAIHSTDWGISVGAVDSAAQMTDFSNNAGFTELNYIVAPGNDVYSTIPDDEYDSYSGTSMASPHVAGVAALIMGANPDLTAEEVVALMTETANPDGVTV
ncbi:S8 family serine peptidase [Vacuolonema iberomarrocanum]|uniref:S8 family serine peptidase n=1 Tax=Vacuolonema iberomarrocanum TaxID=3454632 RepID=UPI001A0724FE|nr:S8 family serine peptidase [filamentous cyanobacterium LEGE 07170]